MKNNNIMTKNGTENKESNKREGYRKKKKSVPRLSPQEVEAAKAFQDSLNRAFVEIMYNNRLSGEDMAERLYPCVSASSVVSKIVANTSPNVKSDSKRPDRRNVTIAILAALHYSFGLDINQILDRLLEEFSGTKKDYAA